VDRYRRVFIIKGQLQGKSLVNEGFGKGAELIFVMLEKGGICIGGNKVVAVCVSFPRRGENLPSSSEPSRQQRKGGPSRKLWEKGPSAEIANLHRRHLGGRGWKKRIVKVQQCSGQSERSAKRTGFKKTVGKRCNLPKWGMGFILSLLWNPLGTTLLSSLERADRREGPSFRRSGRVGVSSGIKYEENRGCFHRRREPEG